MKKQQQIITLCAMALLVLSACKHGFIEPEDGNTTTTTQARVYYTKIDYAAPRADIWSVKPDGSDKKKVIDQAILFSQPHSGKMCYTTAMSGFNGGELYISGIDGSNPIRIASNVDIGVLSPDASKIAFVKNESDGSTTRVFVANSDGTNTIEVMSDAAWETIPAWSPDSKLLAVYRNYEYGQEKNSGLYVMNSDGSGMRRVADYTTVTTENDQEESIEWSPDGKQILTSWIDRQDIPPYTATAYIAIVQVNGTGVSHIPRLTSDANFMGSWMNGGNTVVLSRLFYKPGSTKERDGIYISSCNTQGGNMHDITSKLNGSVLFPRYSPDNSKILYFHINGSYDLDRNRDQHQIEVVSADGASTTVLEQGNVYFRTFWVP